MSVYCTGNNHPSGKNYVAIWKGQEVRCSTRKEAELALRRMHPAWDETGWFRSGDTKKMNPVPIPD